MAMQKVLNKFFKPSCEISLSVLTQTIKREHDSQQLNIALEGWQQRRGLGRGFEGRLGSWGALVGGVHRFTLHCLS